VSANGFFERASDVRTNRPIGFIGQVLGYFRSRSGNNQRPQAAQITTIAIPASPDSSTAYSVVIDGVTCTYTTDASATQAELGAGLEAAIEVQAGARGRMSPSYSGGTLTLTGSWPGISYTVTTSGGTGGGAIGSATTATAAASATAVQFGRALCTDGQVTDEGTPKVFMPTTALFSAQVKTFTYASVASGDSIQTRVVMNGDEILVSTPYNTSHAQSLIDHAAALETALNATFGAGYGAVAARSSDTITITADVAGAEFSAVSDVVGSGGGTVSAANTTGPSISTSVARALIGVSKRRADVENVTVDGDDPAYAANRGVEYVVHGEMLVARDTTETWDRNSQTWVSVSTSATLSGRLYDTGSSTRVWIPQELIRLVAQEPSTHTDGIGQIAVNIGV
jgi:hypothetical protein